MWAHASRHGASVLRGAASPESRFASTQQTRSFHSLRPSLLHHNAIPRSRRLLPIVARAGVPFALQSRGVQASAFPKFVLKTFRVPAGGIAILTGGFAYVNYKVQGSLAESC
jgi:hypothetical protein